ncbi:hypothetical protein [Paraburkholderia diazotrophica]|uniref:hypothetical protein n=1 Tax=Paraburkholderia diazotrophica TaxID=667676 RepID=UPI0031764EE7
MTNDDLGNPNLADWSTIRRGALSGEFEICAGFFCQPYDLDAERRWSMGGWPKRI